MGFPTSEKEMIRHIVLGRVEGAVSTCNGKPQFLFWYTINFYYAFDFFQQNMGFYCYFDSFFK